MGYTPPQISGEATAIGAITGLGAGVKDGVLVRPIFATRAAAASTTTLLVGDASTQEITTGSATHIFKTPVVTTLVAGWATLFVNVSTATVTLNSSGNNLIATLAPGQSVTLKCRSISADTTAAAWDVVGLTPAASLLAVLASNQSLVDATAEALIFQGATGALSTSLNGATGVFTAPWAGTFRFNGVVAYSCTDSTEPNIFTLLEAYKNGTSSGTVGGTAVGEILATTVQILVSSALTNAGGLPFDFKLSLTSGDFIRLDITMSDNGNSGTLTALAQSTSLQITHLPA